MHLKPDFDAPNNCLLPTCFVNNCETVDWIWLQTGHIAQAMQIESSCNKITKLTSVNNRTAQLAGSE